MRLVWLASYPKSGNTWLRFLVHDLCFGPISASIDVSRRIPDLHRKLPFDAPAPTERLYAKTHYLLSPSHPHHAATERAVLVLRHPRDVLLSALNYRRMTGTTEQHLSDRAYAELFIAHRGDPDWKQQRMGSWPEHAASWLAAPFPVLTLRYEDLRADTPAQLRRLADFLSIDATDDRLAQAADRCAFDRLRALEMQEKQADSDAPRLFVGSPDAARQGRLFMNTGRTNQSLAHIAQDLDAAFDRAFAPDLARLGY